jgi:hypothetical protein
LNGTRSDSEPKPHITPKNPKSSRKPANEPQAEADFASFWQAYPRKKGKAAARKAWKAAKNLPDTDALRAAIKQQTKSEQWSNPRFIPYPATWIHGERWNDEPDPPKSATATITHSPKVRL